VQLKLFAKLFAVVTGKILTVPQECELLVELSCEFLHVNIQFLSISLGARY
jgi:hypothetical protein